MERMEPYKLVSILYGMREDQVNRFRGDSKKGNVRKWACDSSNCAAWKEIGVYKVVAAVFRRSCSFSRLT